MNNTIKLESKGHTQMIAHRGMCGLEPENTHAAFVAAGNRSFYGIEADVHKTADGKFIIMHDGNTLRMSGDDIEIAKATYETLRSLRLKQKDGKRGRTDLRIPSMEEYLEICKYYGKKAILELKDEFTAEDIEEIIRVGEALAYMEHIVFISFKMNNLLLLIVCVIGSTPIPRIIGDAFGLICVSEDPESVKKKVYVIVSFVFCVTVIALSTISLVGSGFSAFLYYRF